MSGKQIETALGLIDGNLRRNRDEVMTYIQTNRDAVGRALVETGKVEIPTSAGNVTISREQIKTSF
jgi:hypothetical protein